MTEKKPLTLNIVTLRRLNAEESFHVNGGGRGVNPTIPNSICTGQSLINCTGSQPQ